MCKMQDEVYMSGKHSKVMKMMPPLDSAATSLPCLAMLGHRYMPSAQINFERI